MTTQPSRSTGFIMVAAIVVIVLILAAIGGYLYLSRHPLLTTHHPSVACSYSDPTICRFLNTYHTADHATITISGNDPDNGPSVTTIQFKGANASHTTYTVNNQTMYDLITIGQTTYTKDFTDNKWWRQSRQASSPSQADFQLTIPSATDSADPADQVTFTAQGKDNCGQLTCFKYQSITGGDANSPETFWFDDHQYLLRRIQTSNPDGTKSTATYDYNSVTINPPVEVKDPTPGLTILPNGQTMPAN